MLHLLHASPDRWAPGITATLHQWHDIAAMLSQVPDGARRAGFGGLGFLIDAAAERIATVHMVFRLRLGGSGQYRIEPVICPGHPGPRRLSATGSGGGGSARTRHPPGPRRRCRVRSRTSSTRPGCWNTG